MKPSWGLRHTLIQTSAFTISGFQSSQPQVITSTSSNPTSKREREKKKQPGNHAGKLETKQTGKAWINGQSTDTRSAWECKRNKTINE